jgi:hypothetical protein
MCMDPQFQTLNQAIATIKGVNSHNLKTLNPQPSTLNQAIATIKGVNSHNLKTLNPQPSIRRLRRSRV